jgi:hypothetical protein
VNDCDLETARRLLQAIRDEPLCDDPTCCPPLKDTPVLTNPWTVIKTAAGILIAALLGVFLVILVVLG